MGIGLIAQAVALFAQTNIDDIVVLALFFGQTTTRRGMVGVVIGQYLGFAGILVAAVIGALGAGFLPGSAIPNLGLLPLALGIKAAWTTWPEHHRTGTNEEPDGAESTPARSGPSQPNAGAVAAVTFANGGDNIGVYVPVFATSGRGSLITYEVVFLFLVAVWCAAGRFLASRPIVARAISRWGHIIFPVVLIGIGVTILIEGGAFGS